MGMEVVFLGTGSDAPTLKRWHSGVLLNLTDELVMFDCGEGMQIRFQEVGLNPMRLKNIFITHMHGDHFFGLPGLLLSMGVNQRKEPLTIYVPKGGKQKLTTMFDLRTNKLGYKLEIKECGGNKPAVVCETDKYTVQAISTKHSVPNVAYSFIGKNKVNVDKGALKRLRLKSGPYLKKVKAGKTVTIDGKKVSPKQVLHITPGKKVVYTGNTTYDKRVVILSRGADMLIHESTYGEDHRAKATEYSHSTAGDAARVAREARVKKLILTHFSRRYNDVSQLLAEAQKIFVNTAVAEDLSKFSL